MRVLFGYREKEIEEEELKSGLQEEKNMKKEIKKWNFAITLLILAFLGITVYLIVLASLGDLKWYATGSSTSY